MKHLEIRQKLILLVAFALAMLLALGGFAWYQAAKGHQSLLDAQGRHRQILQVVDRARSAQVHFKMQVQEWKDLLLRGKDQEAYEKYLKGFGAQGKQVVEHLGELKKAASELGIADELKLDEVLSTFAKLEPAYLDALKQYDRGASDPASVVDKAVKGIDRAPTASIEVIVNKVDDIAKGLAEKETAEANARYAETKLGITLFAIGAFAITGMLALIILRSIRVPLSLLEKTMLNIAATNDLALRASVGNRDEIGRMAEAFNGMVQKLQLIVRQVSAANMEVNGAAGQLSETATTLRESSDQQSESISASAASIEQLTVSITTVSDTADEVHRLSSESVGKTAEGNIKVGALTNEIHAIQEIVNQISGAVEEFVRSTSAITDMTQEVREIADKTNLLALNAAIEAARAGDQGRGFAVVADEVRKLAEKSSATAGEIDGMARSIIAQSEDVRNAIRNGTKAIQASTGLAVEVQGTIEQARESVEHAERGIDEIAHSVREQKLASTEIAQNMEHIANAAERSSSAAKGMSGAATALKQSAGELNLAIAGFHV